MPQLTQLAPQSYQFFQIINPISNHKMKQKSLIISPVKQLHLLYPDIEGELCSRHSTLFGKLRTTFNKLYDNMQPTYYVIVKGNCQFVEEQLTELRLSMALENGVIIMVSKTYPQSQIFINCNHFSEQVIFSPTGELQQGLNTMSTQLSTLIKTATSNLSPTESNGGILYIHSNIPQNQFNYKQSLFISVYLSLLSLNDNLKNFNTNQMIDTLTGLGFAGRREQIERTFHGYHNRKFNLTLPDLLSMKDHSLDPIELEPNTMVEEENEKKALANHTCLIQKSQLMLDMHKDYKFLFCKLDLAKEDVNYQFQRRHEMTIRKNQLLEQLKQLHGVTGLFELFYKLQQINLQSIQFKSEYEKSYNPKSMEDLESTDENQILKSPNKFLECLLRQIELVSNFSNQKLSLQELINEIWQINSKGLKLHSSQVVQLVEDMKETLEIKGCMIVSQDFLMIVVHKNRFTELLCEVKHKMNKGELKSKSLFKIQDEELIVQRWSSDKVIGQKIFSSVPSEGLGVFDPVDAIWFD